MKIFIYALKDPITNEIRYIGKTKLNLNMRLKQHLTDAHGIINKTGRRRINKRYSWIISLLKKNLLPIISLLEETNETCWQEREKFLISQHTNLVNSTIGGDGGATTTGMKFGNRTPEQKLKISNATKIAMQRPEIRLKCSLGGYIASKKLKEFGVSEEIKRKISKNVKIAMQNPEIRQRHLLGIKRYFENKRVEEEKL
jgi:hypothetical protein